MLRRGTQRTAPYCICRDMRKPMIFQWFPWYGIVIPGRAAGGASLLFLALAFQVAGNVDFHKVFNGFPITIRSLALFFLALRKNHEFPLFFAIFPNEILYKSILLGLLINFFGYGNMLLLFNFVAYRIQLYIGFCTFALKLKVRINTDMGSIHFAMVRFILTIYLQNKNSFKRQE